MFISNTWILCVCMSKVYGRALKSGYRVAVDNETYISVVYVRNIAVTMLGGYAVTLLNT